MATDNLGMDDKALEDAAILLMSLGEEEAAEVFKHLAPKEVQRLGETIARMKSMPRERVETACWTRFRRAGADSMLVTDTDEYVKACCARRWARTRPTC
jgi:flagellar motor switch protein FliG